MSQSPASHDASSGALFSIERDRDALVEAVGDPDYADRLEALVADDGRAQSARLRALLQVGAERFGVETGLLARVDPAAGTHTIVERHGPSPAGPDDTADLSTTYGRTVIAENAVLGVTNAPEQGWDEDAAYDRFGAATYLGAKVVADGTLYGTVSFLDPDSRPDPFGEADAAALGLLADAIRRVLEREEGPPTPTRQQLEAVFEGSPVMINLHDLEGNLIAPNAHLCEKTGYSADELTQMNVWDLDQEVTPDRARANWADMAPGDRHRWEGRFRRKDGSTFPVEVDLRRLDVSGSARFAVTSRDITERKEAEAALRRSEELHRTTLGNITDAVLIAADDGTLTYVCPNVGYIFGYDQQEAERLGTVSALLGRDPAADHTLDDGEEITNVEQAITDAEGERHDLLINIRRVSIQGGTRMYTCRDITERKAAERELRSTKRLLEKTFESLDEVVLVVDPSQRRIVACNSAVEGTFGYDREELIGHSTEKLHVSPAAYERFGDIGEPILEAEGLFKHDYQMRRKDGTLIETEHVVTPLEGDDGPNGVVSVIRDVTERRRAERSLRKREDQLRGLANSLPGVVFQFYTRPDGTRGNYFVSEHTRSVLGIEADPDTFFERFRRRVPDAHRERFVASVETAVEQAEPWRHETPFDKPSGERIWLLGASTPVRREGELVYNGVLIDITERKAAEQALQDERDRFATLFHNLPTPVVRGRADDGRLQIRAVNEAFETTFGYDEDDARNEDIQALIVPEEERPTADSIRRRVLVGEPTIREVQREAVDGRRDFRVQVAIREGDAGPVEGFAIYTDITERKERERALAQRTALLEAQAEATIDGLLAVDDDRRVVFHNDPFLTLWALSAAAGDASGDALPGQRPLEALSDRVRRPEAFRETVASLYDRPDAEDRTLIRRTDGRWLDQYSAPIVGDDGVHFGRLWVFRDVTEQRRMRERLLEVQEEERRRIDQEIHDEMGGLLTSLQFTVDLARRQVGDGEGLRESLDQVETLVSDLSTVARTISRKVYPTALSDYGLAGTLPSLADEVEQKRGLAVDLRVELGAQDRFSSLVERTAYWIVQEALVNVARHAETDAARVAVAADEDCLTLEIADEGVGFGADAPDGDSSFGLEGIRRRVERLDGDVEIASAPGEGTHIVARLPLRVAVLDDE